MTQSNVTRNDVRAIFVLFTSFGTSTIQHGYKRTVMVLLIEKKKRVQIEFEIKH